MGSDVERVKPAEAADRPSARRARRPRRPAVIAAIAAGGALGAPARYGVAQLVHTRPGSFPWATFWTNVSGSLALGFVLVLLLDRFPPSQYARPFVATGFLGAYTTYSTFAVDTVVLGKDGHVAVALAYVLASLTIGLLAVWIGMVAGRLLPLPHRGGRP
jgi:CrcB protein